MGIIDDCEYGICKGGVARLSYRLVSRDRNAVSDIMRVFWINSMCKNKKDVMYVVFINGCLNKIMFR